MKGFFHHVRVHVIRGLLAVIPLGITYVVIRFLYVMIDQKIMGAVSATFGFRLPGLGILLLVLILYLLGLVASNVLGRQLFHLMDKIFHHIPLIKSIYQAGKQLTFSLSLPDRQAFKRAVLVKLKPDVWTLAFVTGEVADRKHKNERWLKVFVPMPPNPISGTILLVKESETRDPGWTLEEALRTVMSDGVIGASEMK